MVFSLAVTLHNSETTLGQFSVCFSEKNCRIGSITCWLLNQTVQYEMPYTLHEKGL